MAGSLGLDKPPLAPLVPAVLMGSLLVAASDQDVVSRASAPVDRGWTAGRAVPIAVNQGQARLTVPTAGPASRTLVVVSALTCEPGPFPMRLQACPASHAVAPTLAEDGPRLVPDATGRSSDPSPVAREGRVGGGGITGLVANPQLGPPAPGGKGSPDESGQTNCIGASAPAERVFTLMVREGDPASAENYLPVRGRLRAVGRYVQAYVDSCDGNAVPESVLRDLVTTFDEQVYPQAVRRWGPAQDVDRDGRFTVLLTGWLGRLGGGRLAADGFVRGADFDTSLAPPFSNRCDLMYLNTALREGPHLRTVLAHEYAHAVTFSHKIRRRTEAGRSCPDEEGWLDEAIAHLAEDLHGFSRSNLDYRVSAFLSQPERYQLVVRDYFAADLFRSPGHRGSTYLFLRWCVAQYGPEILGALMRSDRRGIANIEGVTGSSFAGLFRRWTTALYLDGLRPGGLPAEGWVLAGPRPSHVIPGGLDDAWTSAGTSSHYAVVDGSTAGAVQIEVDGPPEADVQVTAVPLPPDLPRIELAVRPVPGPDDDGPRVRMRVRGCDASEVRLTALAWEPLTPAVDPRAAGDRRGGLDAAALTRVLGTATLPPRGQLASGPIPLAGVRRDDGPIVVKLLGTDAAGRQVAAWAELPQAGAAEDAD